MRESIQRGASVATGWGLILMVGSSLAGCRSVDFGAESSGAEEALDRWHRAAADVDAATYLELFAPDGVFLGTAPGERWERASWQEFVSSYFGKGIGWKYLPHDRHLTIAPDADSAWFDEALSNDKYGELRGTGLLRKYGEEWRIVQYNMTFPVPNEITPAIVQQIRAFFANRPQTSAQR